MYTFCNFAGIFRFTVISSSFADVTIEVEDEYTYFDADKPLLEGAKVVIYDRVRDITHANATDSSG